jgi:hypothetical protein
MSAGSVAPAAGRRDPWRAVGTTVLLCLLGLLAVHGYAVLADCVSAIGNPLELDYGEGIVWQQAALIPGERMYGNSAGLPFIVFHYPPVFHLLARAALRLEPDFLAAGRLVASVATLSLAPILAGLVLTVAGGADWRAVGVAAAVGLLAISLHPVHSWGYLMRVDMPGFAFGFAGLLLAARADGRFWGTAAALLLCVDAVFTKQTLLSPGIAVFVIGVLRRPKPALAAGVVAGAVGLAALFWLQAATGGGFLQNIVGYNINRVSFWQGYHLLGSEKLTIPVILLLGTAAVWLGLTVVPSALSFRPRRIWREIAALRRAAPASAAQALMLLHFALATVMLVTIFKVGGGPNYLIEWLCSGCVILGVMVIEVGRRTPGGRSWSDAGLFALLLSLQFVPFRLVVTPENPNWLAAADHAVAMIKDAAPRPVASEDMTLLMRAGTGVTFEPSIVTELASVGRWDETPLLQMINSHGFAFVLTIDTPDGFHERRTPAVNEAFRTAYPRLERVGPQIWVRLPAE